MTKSLMVIAAAMGVMGLGLGNAHAQTSVVVTNPWARGLTVPVQDVDTKTVVQDANRSITDAINKMNQDTQDSLRNSSGQQTANMQQRTQADAALRETQDNRGVQQRVESARYHATIAASSGAAGCNIMTGVVGATGLFNTSDSARTQLTDLSLDYQLGESRDAAVRNGTQAAVQERLGAVCAGFATQGMVDEGICTSVTQPNAVPGRVSDTLNANTLLATGVLDPNAQKAARLFVSNAFIPSPMGPVPRNIADTPEGRGIIAARWTSAARNSLALSAFNTSIAMRIPVDEAKLGNPGKINNPDGSTTPTTTVRQWAEGTAKGMLGGKPDGQNYPTGISLWAWMDLRAKSFYLDPNFQATVNRHSADENTKDSVLIQGVQTYLQWEQFKQQERTNVLLATMVSMMDQQMSAQAPAMVAR